MVGPSLFHSCRQAKAFSEVYYSHYAVHAAAFEAQLELVTRPLVAFKGYHALSVVGGSSSSNNLLKARMAESAKTNNESIFASSTGEDNIVNKNDGSGIKAAINYTNKAIKAVDGSSSNSLRQEPNSVPSNLSKKRRLCDSEAMDHTPAKKCH